MIAGHQPVSAQCRLGCDENDLRYPTSVRQGAPAIGFSRKFLSRKRQWSTQCSQLRDAILGPLTFCFSFLWLMLRSVPYGVVTGSAGPCCSGLEVFPCWETRMAQLHSWHCWEGACLETPSVLHGRPLGDTSQCELQQRLRVVPFPSHPLS